jgi:hypothetical protein
MLATIRVRLILLTLIVAIPSRGGKLPGRNGAHYRIYVKGRLNLGVSVFDIPRHQLPRLQHVQQWGVSCMTQSTFERDC